MPILTIKELSQETPQGTLWTLPTLHIQAGDRIGLIGKNGAGKSSLLEILAGKQEPTRGQVTSQAKIAYVPQMKDQTTQSGGQQVWNAIQAALAQSPDLLLLDEPSANLDRVHQEDLIRTINNFPGAILLVTHDRYLLDRTCSILWTMQDGRIEVFKGSYQDYQDYKDTLAQKQASDYLNYQRKLQQLERAKTLKIQEAQNIRKKKKGVSWSDYQGSGGALHGDGQQKAISKNAKAIQRRIDRLEKVERPHTDRNMILKPVGRLVQNHQTLIRFQEGDLAIEGRVLFHYPSIKWEAGQKIALCGPNQAGKTSFFKAIIGQALPAYYAPDLRLGYFSQDLSHIRPQQQVWDWVQANSLQDSDTIRRVLASLGFPQARWRQACGSLSGGEQVRLALARLLLEDVHGLLLDEPTNFLDLSTLEVLEDFLATYPGALLLISHDQGFIDAVTSLQYQIKEGALILPDQDQARQNQGDRLLLEHQLQAALSDPTVPIETIHALRAALEQLDQ